ncbi:MAG: ribonuclease VapC [Methanobacterium sp.]|uniref:ribonuclease VapC n=1 Tax=Methanobacterium sp. TaxID=2164 RepID=UPI003D64DEF4|nr:ribonuclease VapC [Methanobacterium sp.]
MHKKIFVLDASSIIGGFYSKLESNFTTSSALLEIKDLKSSLLLETALKEGRIKIEEPDMEDLIECDKIIKSSGDILRLSDVDKSIVALALKFKRNSFKPVVMTDDYSMQNALKTANIGYKSILTDGIKEIYNWVKICKGCKKKYSYNYQFEDCEICGSPIMKKRIKTKK